jgi:hypothetical protein
MSVGDGTDSSTRVPTARGAWVPAAVSFHARHSMPLPFSVLNAPGYDC